MGRLVGAALLFATVTPCCRRRTGPSGAARDVSASGTRRGIVDSFRRGGPPVAWRTTDQQRLRGPAVAGGRVFLTDSRRTTANKAIERAIALDEKTGKILWTERVGDRLHGLQLVFAIGPRATPTVDGDRVYVLGTMGELLALDVQTGRVLWQKDYVKDYDAAVPSWGMAVRRWSMAIG